MPLRDFKTLRGKKVLLLTHSGCDVDSFGSAAAIYLSLKGFCKPSIGVPEHINTTAKNLSTNLSIPYTLNPGLDGFDDVVCLDFNEPAMLGGLEQEFLAFKGTKFLIDHHSPAGNRIAPAANSLVSPKAVSTTELVYGLLKSTKVKIPQKALACIACGIITDSSSFLVADHSTFSIMAEVMQKAKMPYREIISLFRTNPDISQRIASLKASRRSRIYRANDTLIVTSRIGSYEADAANALVRIGADVAFCGDTEKGLIRVSGRANSNWLAGAKINLAEDVFAKLSSHFPGNGGGHAGAAGFNGKGEDIEAVLLKCTELVAKKLPGQQSLKEYTE